MIKSSSSLAVKHRSIESIKAVEWHRYIRSTDDSIDAMIDRLKSMTKVDWIDVEKIDDEYVAVLKIQGCEHLFKFGGDEPWYFAPPHLRFSKVVSNEIPKEEYALGINDLSTIEEKQITKIEVSFAKPCRVNFTVRPLKTMANPKLKKPQSPQKIISTEDLTDRSVSQPVEFKHNNYSHEMLIILPKSNEPYVIVLNVIKTDISNIKSVMHEKIDEDSTFARFIPILSFSVTGRFTDQLPLEYPRFLRYQADFDLLAPISGRLPAGKMVRFKIIVESAVRVMLYQIGLPISEGAKQKYDLKSTLALSRGSKTARGIYSCQKSFDHTGLIQIIAQMSSSYRYVKICEFIVESMTDEIAEKVLNAIGNKTKKKVVAELIEPGDFRLAAKFLTKAPPLPNKLTSLSDLVSILTALKCQEHTRITDSSMPLSSCYSCHMVQLASLYKWIINNVVYRSINKDALESPSEVVKSRQAVCRGFSALFHWCCTQLGIECYLIDGHTKSQPGTVEFVEDMGEPHDQEFNASNHQWNLVLIENRGFLVDCTFGACQLKSGQSNIYFMCNPDALICTHFPEEPIYSLVPSYKLDPARILKSPCIYPEFLNYSGQFRISLTLNAPSSSPTMRTLDIFTDLKRLSLCICDHSSPNKSQPFPVKITTRPVESTDDLSQQSTIGCLSLEGNKVQRYRLVFSMTDGVNAVGLHASIENRPFNVIAVYSVC